MLFENHFQILKAAFCNISPSKSSIVFFVHIIPHLFLSLYYAPAKVCKTPPQFTSARASAPQGNSGVSGMVGKSGIILLNPSSGKVRKWRPRKWGKLPRGPGWLMARPRLQCVLSYSRDSTKISRLLMKYNSIRQGLPFRLSSGAIFSSLSQSHRLRVTFMEFSASSPGNQSTTHSNFEFFTVLVPKSFPFCMNHFYYYNKIPEINYLKKEINLAHSLEGFQVQRA